MGKAYGLISDWHFDPVTKDGVIFLTNGAWNGYSFGNNSAFYTLEEDVFAAGEEVLDCTADVVTAAVTSAPVVPNFGCPGEAISCYGTGTMLRQDALGKTVHKPPLSAAASSQRCLQGAYFIRMEGLKPVRFTVL
jgi:hypothetical protein